MGDNASNDPVRLFRIPLAVLKNALHGHLERAGRRVAVESKLRVPTLYVGLGRVISPR
jgi:hypothetical protein